MSPEIRVSETNDRSLLQTDFAMQLSALGSIQGLREDIQTLGSLMGSRKQALEAISSAAGIPVGRIEAIIHIPEIVNFSSYRNPLSGELEDPSNLISDPDADTAMEATEQTFNAGLRQVLEEIMNS